MERQTSNILRGSSSDRPKQGLEQLFSEKASELFALCDTEMRGYIQKGDIMKLEGELPLSADQLEDVFDVLESDGKGYLTLEEFTRGFIGFMDFDNEWNEQEQVRHSSSKLHHQVSLYEEQESEQDSVVCQPSFIREETLDDAVNLEADEQLPVSDVKECSNSRKGELLGGRLDDDQEFDLLLRDLEGSFVEDQDYLKILWREMKDEQPHLLENFKEFLERIIKLLRKSKTEFNSLESAFKHKSSLYNEQVKRLYEEMEQHIHFEREKIISETAELLAVQRTRKVVPEEKEREKKLKEQMEEELHLKEQQLQQLVAKQQKMEHRLKTLKDYQTTSRHENEQLLNEKHDLESTLEQYRNVLELSQRSLVELQKQQREERRARAHSCLKVSEAITMDRAKLLQQLEMLRNLNQKLCDDRDELEAEMLSRSTSCVSEENSNLSSELDFETRSRRMDRAFQKRGSVMSDYFTDDGEQGFALPGDALSMCSLEYDGSLQPQIMLLNPFDKRDTVETATSPPPWVVSFQKDGDSGSPSHQQSSVDMSNNDGMADEEVFTVTDDMPSHQQSSADMSNNDGMMDEEVFTVTDDMPSHQQSSADMSNNDGMMDEEVFTVTDDMPGEEREVDDRYRGNGLNKTDDANGACLSRHNNFREPTNLYFDETKCDNNESLEQPSKEKLGYKGALENLDTKQNRVPCDDDTPTQVNKCTSLEERSVGKDEGTTKTPIDECFISHGNNSKEGNKQREDIDIVVPADEHQEMSANDTGNAVGVHYLKESPQCRVHKGVDTVPSDGSHLDQKQKIEDGVFVVPTADSHLDQKQKIEDDVFVVSSDGSHLDQKQKIEDGVFVVSSAGSHLDQKQKIEDGVFVVLSAGSHLDQKQKIEDGVFVVSSAGSHLDQKQKIEDGVFVVSSAGSHLDQKQKIEDGVFAVSSADSRLDPEQAIEDDFFAVSNENGATAAVAFAYADDDMHDESCFDKSCQSSIISSGDCSENDCECKAHEYTRACHKRQTKAEENNLSGKRRAVEKCQTSADDGSLTAKGNQRAEHREYRFRFGESAKRVNTEDTFDVFSDEDDDQLDGDTSKMEADHTGFNLKSPRNKTSPSGDHSNSHVFNFEPSAVHVLQMKSKSSSEIYPETLNILTPGPESLLARRQRAGEVDNLSIDRPEMTPAKSVDSLLRERRLLRQTLDFRKKSNTSSAYNSQDSISSAHPAPIYLPERVFKVVMVGDSGVGKSCFIHRICSDEFKPFFHTTIGVDFQVKSLVVDNFTVVLQLWDTAGQERFRSITKQYFRKADGVIVMYDVTSEKTFISMREWMSSVQDGVNEGTVVEIVGNKTDLTENDTDRPITFKDGSRLADGYGTLFFETSVKTGDNVMEALKALASLLKEKEDEELEKTIQIDIASRPTSWCCKD